MLAMLATTSLTSCGDDDDDDAIDTNSLVGTWQEYSEEAWWDYGDGDKGHETEVYDNKDVYYCYITFNADGTWSERWFEKAKGSSEHTSSGTWNLSGNTLTMTDESKEEWSVKISINGNTMTSSWEEKDDGDWDKEVVTYKKMSK